MELTTNQKLMIREAVRLCAKNADCEVISRIFEEAGWNWIDCVTKENFTPTELDIRRRFYRLGMDAYESVCEDYEGGRWSETNPTPYTKSSGRLFFTIDWQEYTDLDDYDIIKDAHFVCGINTELCAANFDGIDKEEFGVYSCDDYGREETTITKL